MTNKVLSLDDCNCYAAWGQEGHDTHCPLHEAKLLTRIKVLVKERDALKKKLAKYGNHTNMCASHEVVDTDLECYRRSCDCGFTRKFRR